MTMTSAPAPSPSPQHLDTLRPARGLTQRSPDSIRKLARALRVSADSLVFEQDERGPDEEVRLQFEAFTQFDKDEQKAARTLLDALILKHQTRRWALAS